MMEGDSTTGFFGPDDPPTVRILGADSRLPLVLGCDHGGNAVPEGLGTLGIDRAHLWDHIGYDIGAAAVACGVAERLGATAVVAQYSRLIVDCNREPGLPTAIPAESDGIPIPANRGLSEPDCEARTNTFFWPYHQALGNTLGRRRRAGVVPILITVHSFTPTMNGRERPWHVGVLWHRDTRIADRLRAAFARETDLVVGKNEPYSGTDHGYTIQMHGETTGIPHAALEIRQDLLADAAGVGQWIDRLAALLPPILEQPDPALREITYF